MLLSGVLFKFGYFHFWGVIAVLMTGYFLNGIFWYLIGRAGGIKFLERRAKRWRFTRKLIEKLEHYFEKHRFKAIFISRITYGFSMFVLIIAGSIKMKWKEVLSVTLLATIFWVCGMVGLGYVFGLGHAAMGRVMQIVAAALTILIFVLMIFSIVSAIYYAVYLIKKKAKKEETILEKTEKVFNHLFKDEN